MRGIAKLRVDGRSKPYEGTAWLCSQRYALTAAHCIGDRRYRILFPGPISLAFRSTSLMAKVSCYNFDLDVALLEVSHGDVADDLEPIPLGILPKMDRWPTGTQKVY